MPCDAAASGTWLWLDMEGSAYTDRTLDLAEALMAEHDDVGAAAEELVAFDEADVVERTCLEERRRLPDRVVTLGILDTDVEQRHARCIDRLDVGGDQRAHDGELEQVLRRTQCVRSEIQHVQ